LEPSREHPHVPGPSLWPVGLAIGVVVFLVGFVTSRWIVVLGALIVIAFAALWIRELAVARHLEREAALEPEPAAELPEAPAPSEAPAPPEHAETYGRDRFLEASTLGLGALIGAVVTLPVLGFMVLPAFLDQGVDSQDVGPVDEYPEGEWIVTTFTLRPEQGDVSRLTTFVRYNGLLDTDEGVEPSYTVIANRCAHLGCPVQPNGALDRKNERTYKDVTLIPTQPSGFGCPCHGGQYDTEGNRVSGPPVRALDRHEFSIVHRHLYIGEPFTVAKVEGTGKNAKIYRHPANYPGVHVDGVESWLYPIPPPR
jgi:menaquinol-cytochrome c reductase iron-sulfur subunit